MRENHPFGGVAAGKLSTKSTFRQEFHAQIPGAASFGRFHTFVLSGPGSNACPYRDPTIRRSPASWAKPELFLFTSDYLRYAALYLQFLDRALLPHEAYQRQFP